MAQHASHCSILLDPIGDKLPRVMTDDSIRGSCRETGLGMPQTARPHAMMSSRVASSTFLLMSRCPRNQELAFKTHEESAKADAIWGTSGRTASERELLDPLGVG